MAIYHLRLTQISRTTGHHAVNSAAYRHGTEMVSLEGELFNWGKKKEEVVYSNILVPERSALWVEDLILLELKEHDRGSEKLWNLVEQTENRKDAQLFYEFEVSIPKELETKQQIELIENFVRENLTKRGMIVDYSIHHVSGNPHAHIACTTREITKDGFGKKVTQWKDKAVLYSIREGWANSANYALRKAGLDLSISHKSYKERGIDLQATVHEGAARHISAEANLAFAHNDKVRRENFNKIINSPDVLVKKIASERETFTRADLMAEFMRHAPTGKDFTPQIRARMLETLDALTPQMGMSKDKLFNETTKEVNHDKLTIEKVFTSLNATKSVFTEYDLARAVNEATSSAEQFTALFEKLKLSNNLINLGPGEDGKMRFTTQEAFALENAIQETAENLNIKLTHKVSNKLANKYAKQYKLSESQTAALKHILGGNDISAVVGYAGTGKSYLLGCAKEAWEEAGFNVQGIALAGIAADGLTKDANIPSRTIESFILALKQQRITIGRNDIVVMDEAGMTDNLGFAEVLSRVAKAGAKLVLVGDDAQLAPVGPGAAFRAIIERTGCAVLDNVIRQKETWQRQATKEFALNKTFEALSRYGVKNCVHLLDTTAEAKQQLSNDWFAAIQNKQPLSQQLILAFKNEDVNELNKLAREKLIASNLLGEESTIIATKLGNKDFRLGERIIFLENNSRVGVKNGRRATIVGLEEKSLQVHLDGDQEKITTIDTEKYNNFDYGYASTVHKAQGMTVLNSFVLAVGRWSKNLSYVAMTRHKETANLYGGKDLFDSIDKLKKHMSRWDLKDIVLDFPIQFMQRRGINVDPAANNLATHWKNKINDFISTLEKHLSPDSYYHKQALEEKARETIKRREHAKIVGTDYIAARANARDAWQALVKVGEHIMCTKELDNVALIKELEKQNHPALEIYRTACKTRNEVAYNIWNQKDKLTKALELNAIDLEYLEKQALQHQYATNVNTYLMHLKSGKVVLQDKLAHVIQNEFNKHYTYLLENKVDTKLLSQHALQHSIRTNLISLSKEEKQAIRLYNDYLIANKKSYEAWQIISSNTNSGHKTIRSMMLYAEKLAVIRDEKAFKFVKNLNHQKVLKLFGIKDYTDIPDKELKPEKLWQKRKLERLYMYAGGHEAKSLINEISFSSGTNQAAAAFKICSDPKKYHGAICRHTKDVAGFWQNLRKLAQQHKENLLIYDLNWNEQVCLEKVKKYVEANRALGKSWAELAETKKVVKEIPDEIMQQVTNLARLRDELAHKSLSDPNYNPALEFFNIDTLKMVGHSYRYEARDVIKKFKKSIGNIEARAKLAQTITADPQLYYGPAKEQGINFLSFYPYARYGNKLDILSQLTPEGQKDYRLAERYLQLVRKAGKYWANINDEQVINWQSIKEGQAINAERDAIAALINTNPDRFIEIRNLIGRNFTKLEAHAENHIKRRDEVTNYLANHYQLIEIIERFNNSSQSLPDNYRQAWNNSIKVGYRLKNQADKYKEIFKELNITENDFTSTKLDIAKQSKPINAEIYAPQYKHYDIESINLYLENNARDFATQLLGAPTKRSNNQQLYFGSKNGSLCLTIQGDHAGLWHDFASGDGGNLVTLAQRELGLNFKEALEYCAAYAGIIPCSSLEKRDIEKPLKTKHEQKAFTKEQLDKISYVKNIAESGQDLIDTIVNDYLTSRKINNVNSSDLKYVSIYEPTTKTKVDAMLCIARNEEDEIQSTQIIYLDKDGKKLPNIDVTKRTYGVINGAACLVNKGKDENIIYLAEGPETALSVAQAKPEATVFATFGVSNFSKIPLSLDTQKVIICADNDGINSASYKQTMKAVDTLVNKGIDVDLVMPEQEKQDFNDVLIKQGKEELNNQLENVKSYYLDPNGRVTEKTIEYYQQKANEFEKLITKHEHALDNKEQYTEYETYKIFKDLVFFAISLEKDPQSIELLSEEYKEVQIRSKELLYPGFFKEPNLQNISVPKDPDILVKTIISRIEEKEELIQKLSSENNFEKRNNLEEELMTLIHYAEKNPQAFTQLENSKYKETIEQRTLNYRSYKKQVYENAINKQMKSKQLDRDMGLDDGMGLEVRGYELVIKNPEEKK